MRFRFIFGPLLTGLLLLAGPAVRAQVPLRIDAAGLPATGLDLRPGAGFAETTDLRFYPASVRRPARFGIWPDSAMEVRLLSQKLWGCWLRFSLCTNGPPARLVLLLGEQAVVQLYEQTGDGRLRLTEQSGYQMPKRAVSARTGSVRAVSVWVRTGRAGTWYVRVVSSRIYQSPVSLRLFTPDLYRAYLYDVGRQEQPFFLSLTGILACLLLLACFWLFQYSTHRDPIYVWYSGYLLLIFGFLLRSFELWFSTGIVFADHPIIMLAATPFLSVGSLYAYIHFVGLLLNLHRDSRFGRLIRFCRVYFATLLVLMAGGLAMLGFIGMTRLYYAGFQVLIAGIDTLFIGLFLGLVWQSRHPLRAYVLTASACLALGAVVSIALNLIPVVWHKNELLTMPTFWFAAGTLLEVFFLSVALGQRTQLFEADKQRTEQTLALEQARYEQSVAAFTLKLSQTEMAALRAQMNPHFIFNCLNSIQFFTARNEAEKASDYLGKFSRLIRLVLENSKSDKVTLTNELETLRLYMDMEAMRFEQKVQYLIRVAEEVEVDAIEIPPLLLQPFVENAIWHGLMHKDAGGTVLIEVGQPRPACLRVTISDDGIGRAQAAVYKSKSATKNKSFGLKLTAERIELINQLYQTQTRIEVIDLADTAGQPTGTRVVVEIPV